MPRLPNPGERGYDYSLTRRGASAYGRPSRPLDGVPPDVPAPAPDPDCPHCEGTGKDTHDGAVLFDCGCQAPDRFPDEGSIPPQEAPPHAS
jgi:hypothetical protein